MPEIKHNFTGGKMNKDLDERLVPNGEYRDAMNIQVSTSEDSEVGTIQNILGNKEISSFIIPELKEHCVASVADEKNDVGYYFIAGGENFTPYELGQSFANALTPQLERDMIVRFNGVSVTPVFVDPYLKTAVCYFSNMAGGLATLVLELIQNPYVVEKGDIITRVETQTEIFEDVNIPIEDVQGGKLYIDMSAGQGSTWGPRLLTAFLSVTTRIIIDRRDSRVLKFDVVEDGLRSVDKLITGINVIDDMLFWTDGFTEPKKINIDRSINGTYDTFRRTKIVKLDNVTGEACEEKHITVIKKRPNKAPTIGALTSFRSGIISSTASKFNGSPPFGDNTGPKNIGSVLWIAVDDDDSGNEINFKTNDVLRFSSNSSFKPPEYYEIRAIVKDVVDGPVTEASATQTAVKIEIISMSSEGESIATSATDWEVALEEIGKPLFEQKLPRFSCRYKYEDNEYSAPGPFSEVVFLPGNFRYHPTEAYNTGMVNTLRELTLQDFIPKDIPKDVIQVDLLYKNDTSPNIYTIESITKEDTKVDGFNAWTSQGSQVGNKGSYKISTENIFSTLPSNQLLRPWDNVPRIALAQDISGNRIIYANYLQNYNLKNISNEKLVPNIITSIGNRSTATDNKGKKSIKSLRDYDVGIVWGDEYGRETPVIAPSSGSISIDLARATFANSLNVELDSEHPD